MGIGLGVNIDHVATLRQARGTKYPEPMHAALIAEQNGADHITLHLREDRRHIQDRDVMMLKDLMQTPMNLEMAVTSEMIAIAITVKPEMGLFVPEKREELTTEGGLDVISQRDAVKNAVHRLGEAGAQVAIFIDPEPSQIDACIDCGAPAVELHTGCYADATTLEQRVSELARVAQAAEYAASQGLIVHAGHGLHYHNVEAVAAIADISDLNIGHAIVAHALFIGFADAVAEMKMLMQQARDI